MMAISTNVGSNPARPGNSIPPAPSTSHFIEAGGLRLHHLDYGTAGRPAMLCIHGGGANAHWYDYVAASFNQQYHVRAIDLRGHGDSAWAEPPNYSFDDYAAEVNAVVEKLDLCNFVLIGHSMGGLVSLTYMKHFGGRVAKLVIVDSSPRMSEARKAEIHSVGARPSRTYATREEVVTRYRLRPEGTSAPREVVRHLAENGVGQAQDGTWRLKFDRRIFANRVFADGIPCWASVRVPALLIKGELSSRITPESFALVKEACSHVELVEIKGSDHHVTLDNPAAFSRAVQAFLAK
jgi:pimeloyl-ACP methyl ester carboxylesterase